MNDELKFTVISDTHYYSKKNFVDGFDKNKKPKPGQLFFSRSEEIVEHTFDCLCKNDTPDIVLISGDLTYNGERTSHDEMKAALKKLQQKGESVCYNRNPRLYHSSYAHIRHRQKRQVYRG